MALPISDTSVEKSLECVQQSVCAPRVWASPVVGGAAGNPGAHAALGILISACRHMSGSGAVDCVTVYFTLWGDSPYHLTEQLYHFMICLTVHNGSSYFTCYRWGLSVFRAEVVLCGGKAGASCPTVRGCWVCLPAAVSLARGWSFLAWVQGEARVSGAVLWAFLSSLHKDGFYCYK